MELVKQCWVHPLHFGCILSMGKASSGTRVGSLFWFGWLREEAREFRGVGGTKLFSKLREKMAECRVVWFVWWCSTLVGVMFDG